MIEARSVHHIVSPVDAPALRYDRTNLALAHRECNGRAGVGGQPVKVTPTKQWL